MSNIEAFIPAKSKLEAVGRISNLTNSGPESLGPGSKERKSVFINLSQGLNLNLDPDKSTKQQLGKQILNLLGGNWSCHCESSGQTVTLIGLNRLLELAEIRLANQFKKRVIETPADEASEILRIAAGTLSPVWNGKECVTEMKEGGSTKWKHTEWQGWYFEYLALGQLVNLLGGGPKKFGVTNFDFSLNFVWDLKVHSTFGVNGPAKLNSDCILNDQGSMRLAINEGGLGLIILSGEPTYSMAFAKWHKEFRGSSGEPKRALKEEFRPTRLEAFYIQSESAFESALKGKVFSNFNQGKQATGEPRKPKYSLNIHKARQTELQIADLPIN